MFLRSSECILTSYFLVIAGKCICSALITPAFTHGLFKDDHVILYGEEGLKDNFGGYLVNDCL